jgi:hypothetical protein
LKSMSDIPDYLPPERHHHVHQVVDQDLAVADAEALTVAGTEAPIVADAEVDGCRFADVPKAFDGCLLAPPACALATVSGPLARTVDAEALTVAGTEALTVADTVFDAPEARRSPPACSSGFDGLVVTALVSRGVGASS